MKLWAIIIFLIIGKKLKVEGIDNINIGGRYILIANHTSLFDIVAIIKFFPDLSWFGHERLTRIPIFRKVLKMINYIPMRKSGFRSTKNMINQLIEKSKGHTIGIFPEGTRSIDGKVNDFYRGFVLLLRNAEIDVLPVTLKGFYDLKPKNRFCIGFDSSLNVVIHEPLMHKELTQKNDNEIIATVKSKIESGL